MISITVAQAGQGDGSPGGCHERQPGHRALSGSHQGAQVSLSQTCSFLTASWVCTDTPPPTLPPPAQTTPSFTGCSSLSSKWSLFFHLGFPIAYQECTCFLFFLKTDFFFFKLWIILKVFIKFAAILLLFLKPAIIAGRSFD